MNISLQMLGVENIQDVFDFEIKNRAHFEKNLPSRGDDYYVFEKYDGIIRGFIEEQNRGECLMCLIVDETGQILGRVNLTSIENGQAELGYRIGQGHEGRGIATIAIGKMIEMASKRGLTKIVAQTSTDNIGSQRVLTKNGFVLAASTQLQLDGKQIDGSQYEFTL